MIAGDVARRISFRPAGPSSAGDMLAVNRACPIESDFTFRFDRDPDFFAWPRAVFDSHEYLGFHDGDRLVGYGLVGYRAGWTGCAWARWAYIGDLRLLPEYRGLGIGRRGVDALIDRVPPDVCLGVFVLKHGNAVAEGLRRSLRLGSLQIRRAGVLDVVSLPVRPHGMARAAIATRPAVSADIFAGVALVRRAQEGRLCAPPLAADGGDRFRADVESGRAAVAMRGDRIVGVITWRDFGDVRRATIVRYPTRSWSLRAAWGLARGAGARIAALPEPGGSLRAATVTHLGTEEDEPAVVRALVDCVMRTLAGGGAHLLQIAEMRGHPILESFQGRCRWIVRLDVWVGWRSGAHSPIADARQRPPFIDLAII